MTEHAAPAQSSERLVSLDVLRGVAVPGILMMNTQAISMPAAAYINPAADGDLTGINWQEWYDVPRARQWRHEPLTVRRVPMSTQCRPDACYAGPALPSASRKG